MDYNNRILIVDDNEAIHRDFRKILQPRIPKMENVRDIEQELFGAVLDEEPSKVDRGILSNGYKLTFAYSAREAIELIRKAEEDREPFALIFTDVRMPPGLDGVQLVEEIIHLAPFMEIVIVTAYADYSWDELVDKFGWTDRILILRKPFDGITIKQVASTLTKKWALAQEARKLSARMSNDLDNLEKQVEERTAKLAQAYKELQSFAYIVSHDLRSPLVSIRGFVSELRFDLERVLAAVDVLLPNLDSEQQKALEVALRENIPEAMDFIDTSTTKMDRLIKGILKLARLGHRKFHYEDVSLADIVDHQLKVLSYPIEKNEVDISVGPLPSVHTDRLALEQILSNVLSNAVKYLAPDRKGEIHVTSRQEDNHHLIEINDNGRGIDQGDLDNIFEIFQRGNARDVPGEGMGLTYVKTLLQRLGGRIWCSSEVGKGSTFYFTLPFTPPPPEPDMGE